MVLDHGLSAVSALGRCSLALTLTGCASFVTEMPASVAGIPAADPDGIVYYMPRRPIQVNLAVDAKDNTVVTPSIGTPMTIPDLSQAYFLKYDRNWVGTNHFVMGVTSTGLLNNASSTTTSSLPQLASAIGSLGGIVSAAAAGLPVPAPVPVPLLPGPVASNCDTATTYSVLIFPEDPLPAPVCGATISVALLGLPRTVNNMRATMIGQDQIGFFYKHDLPYLVTVTEAGRQPFEFLAFSPDQSEISFVPSPKSLFANASTNVTLSQGILTNLDQSTDSEAVAALALPAQVISAYFSAAGSFFSSIGSLSTSQTTLQTTLLANENAVALAQAKSHVCAVAVAANPLSGKAGADLQTALTNIQMACQP